MLTQYFPHTTIHDIPTGMARDYGTFGSVNLHCTDLELCAVLSPISKVRGRIELKVDTTPDRPTPENVKRERFMKLGLKKRTYNFEVILKCIKVVEQSFDDDGSTMTILTRFAGVIDIETLSTRYVIHFDSIHRNYIRERLRMFSVPVQTMDYHTAVVPRLKKRGI